MRKKNRNKPFEMMVDPYKIYGGGKIESIKKNSYDKIGSKEDRIEITEEKLVNYFINYKLNDLNIFETKKLKKIEKLFNNFLKTNKRYQRVKISKTIWKILIDDALKDLTDNTRGIEELKDYFDEFVNYEKLLVAIDENYRDHTIHIIWVMLLGFYIKDKFNVFNNINYSKLKTLVDFKDQNINPYQNMLKKVKEKEDSIWILISLTHDLGYPIEKTKKANEIMSDMIQNFGFLEMKEFDYKFTSIHLPVIEEFLDTLSKALFWVNDDRYKLDVHKGIKIEYGKSFERLNHGVISSYLLFKYLDYICEIEILGDNKLHTPSKDYEIGTNFVLISTLLSTVSSHTNKNSYFLNFNNMESLLFICDEIEEFSRYSFIDEIWKNQKCRTEISLSRSHISIAYSIDKGDYEKDVEELFKDKVRKIHNKYQLKMGPINQVVIQCIDETKIDRIKCKYTKNEEKEKIERSNRNDLVNEEVKKYLK